MITGINEMLKSILFSSAEFSKYTTPTDAETPLITATLILSYAANAALLAGETPRLFSIACRPTTWPNKGTTTKLAICPDTVARNAARQGISIEK